MEKSGLSCVYLIMKIISSILLAGLVFALAGCASTRDRGFVGAASDAELGSVERGNSFSAGDDYGSVLSDPGQF